MKAMTLTPGQSSSSRLPEWRPAAIHLFGPITKGWRIGQPLPVVVARDRETGDYLAADDIFDVWGAGPTFDAAVADYRSSLIEFFEIMAAGREPATREFVGRLSTYLKRT